MRLTTAFFISSLALSSVAKGDQVPIMDERGAVLCSYAITSMMEKYARNCSKEARAKVWLQDLLERHRDFVRRNASASDAELNAFEQHQTTLPQGTPLCSSEEIGMMFEAVLANEGTFRSEIEETLSYDRQPVWNPCL